VAAQDWFPPVLLFRDFSLFNLFKEDSREWVRWQDPLFLRRRSSRDSARSAMQLLLPWEQMRSSKDAARPARRFSILRLGMDSTCPAAMGFRVNSGLDITLPFQRRSRRPKRLPLRLMSIWTRSFSSSRLPRCGYRQTLRVRDLLSTLTATSLWWLGPGLRRTIYQVPQRMRIRGGWASPGWRQRWATRTRTGGFVRCLRPFHWRCVAWRIYGI
jgi:hypothetical protein